MHSAAVDGVTLEYESHGTGDPVALIHLSLYADSFAPLLDQPALAAYRLVRYHRRGYVGSSRTVGPVTIGDQAADLGGLLEYLGVRRAHIAGHSYGGLIALQLALNRPDLVASLVLMEPALRVRSAGPASQDLSRRMALGFQRYRESDRAGAVDGFLTAVFAPGYRQLLDRVIPGGWEQAVRDADMFFGIEVPELQRWQFGAVEAGRITAPTLSLVGGESDPAFFEIEELLRGLLPQLETAPSLSETTTAGRRDPGAVLREAPIDLSLLNTADPNHNESLLRCGISIRPGARRGGDDAEPKTKAEASST